ncbi:MAG TPA: 3-dehydroquinate synthase [Gammaproteobacteria bacterium]|nr:3-dehydroquinate synthase [Gammaproteobacteria bacterium]
MNTVSVNLGERSYPIYVGAGILTRAGEFLKGAGLQGKVALVTNPTVANFYLEPVSQTLTQAGFQVVPVLIPDGEEHKNQGSLELIYNSLVSARLERKSSVVALGGGVIGDLAGFAAATYLRGIPYVQIPTTLLAQVDSSVGGKTGVNHPGGKNLIGAFYQPRLVLIDIDVLSTLPRRELVAGVSEVIKYGVIEDAELFRLLESSIGRLIELDRELLIHAITTSCSIKARVVEQDEREDDYRAVLNFGHTIGHALEAATDYRDFLHGEAVAIGMAKAAVISARRGFCEEQAVERIHSLLEKTGLRTEVPNTIPRERLIQGMEVDKKSAGGKIKFVLCEAIGKTRFDSLSPAEVITALGDQ